MIRWKRGDYIRLGKAVAQFNREIAKNDQITKEVIAPEELNYKDLRDSIQTREGLMYYLKSLQRIKLPDAFNIEELDNGMQITTYSRRELDISKRTAERIISNEIAQLEAQTKANYGIDSDIKLPSAFKSIEQKQAEAKLRDYKTLYKLEGKDFKRRAKQLSVYYPETKYRRAYIFRENYMRIMREKYKKYENFKKFESWAKKHKNPISFYNALPDSEFHPNDLTYQSDTTLQQEDFNSFLESLGIQIEQ